VGGLAGDVGGGFEVRRIDRVRQQGADVNVAMIGKLHALRRFHLVEPAADTQGALYTPPPQPGPVHGTRQAVIGRPGFAMWTVRELTSILAGNLLRWRHSTTTRL
jgi:hypothetical protein